MSLFTRFKAGIKTPHKDAFSKNIDYPKSDKDYFFG